MIGGLRRALDNLLGRGEAAVTVPPLDGALRPNRLLDEANSRAPLDGVDCLAVHGDVLVASANDMVLALGVDGTWSRRASYRSAVACLASVGEQGLAVALADGEIVIEGGPFVGRGYRAGSDVRCITAMAAAGSMLFVANGSATNGSADWQRDLLERNASGSIWRIDLDSGKSTRLASALAWPAGLAVDRPALIFSEAWKHQLVRIDPARPGRPQVLHADLPAYPGRIASAADGYWLAMFAPRSQLVEFVLREPAYRKRMMAEVPQPFWVAPKLRSGLSFYESLQGGGVKHLGRLKPWAPTMSAGMCVKLDGAFQPSFSLQSRADGRTHGVTSAAEYRGQVFVAARGDGVIVPLPSIDRGDVA
jgi:hypothetical protein